MTVTTDLEDDAGEIVDARLVDDVLVDNVLGEAGLRSGRHDERVLGREAVGLLGNRAQEFAGVERADHEEARQVLVHVLRGDGLALPEGYIKKESERERRTMETF